MTHKWSQAQKAATVSLVATTVVVVIKLVAADLSRSVSVLAEGLQSSVDIMMSLLAVLTIRYAALPPDEDHPYGHGKAELLAGAFQMILVMGSAIFVLIEVVRRLQHPEPIGWSWGAAAMAYTIASNLIVAGFVRRAARDSGSAVLESEAQHLVGDTLSSAGVLVGLAIYAMTSVPWIDPLVAGLFTVIAMLMAGRQLQRVLHPLMDGAIPAAERKRVEEVLDTHPQVRGYHNLLTRQSGQTRVVELHVMLDDDLPFVEAHAIAEQIEDEIRQVLGGAKVNIHYEPYEAELKHRAEAHESG